METISSDQSPPDTYWPADASDIWLRHVIEGKAVRATEPRLKVKYLIDKLEIVEDRPWGAEISGRVLSKASDIKEKAESDANKMKMDSMKFRHVIYICVNDSRKLSGIDICEEPKADDKAHANMVAFKLEYAPSLDNSAAPKLSQPFLQKICDKILVCDASDLTAIEALRAV